MDASKAASIGADAVVRKAITLLKSWPYSLVNGYLQGVPIHMEERSRRRVGMPSWMARCSVPRVGLPSGEAAILIAFQQWPNTHPGAGDRVTGPRMAPRRFF